MTGADWLVQMFPEPAVPEGQRGIWTIDHFTVSEDEAERFNARQIGAGSYGRWIDPGTYLRLFHRAKILPETVMSNTPAELRDHYVFVEKARGRVLINGLGLGICLAAVLAKEEVEEVVVVERDEDVIALVGPTFEGDPRVTIICADAMTWRPKRGERFDVVWHDIWPNICADNLDQMKTLTRSYARRTRVWQGCWCRAECEEARKGI